MAAPATADVEQKGETKTEPPADPQTWARTLRRERISATIPGPLPPGGQPTVVSAKLEGVAGGTVQADENAIRAEAQFPLRGRRLREAMGAVRPHGSTESWPAQPGDDGWQPPQPSDRSGVATATRSSATPTEPAQLAPGVRELRRVASSTLANPEASQPAPQRQRRGGVTRSGAQYADGDRPLEQQDEESDEERRRAQRLPRSIEDRLTGERGGGRPSPSGERAVEGFDRTAEPSAASDLPADQPTTDAARAREFRASRLPTRVTDASSGALSTTPAAMGGNQDSQRDRAFRMARREATDRVKQEAVQAGRQAARAAARAAAQVTRAAIQAVISFLAATSEIWVPVLIVIALIAIVLIGFLLIYAYACSSLDPINDATGSVIKLTLRTVLLLSSQASCP